MARTSRLSKAQLRKSRNLNRKENQRPVAALKRRPVQMGPVTKARGLSPVFPVFRESANLRIIYLRPFQTRLFSNTFRFPSSTALLLLLHLRLKPQKIRQSQRKVTIRKTIYFLFAILSPYNFVPYNILFQSYCWAHRVQALRQWHQGRHKGFGFARLFC